MLRTRFPAACLSKRRPGRTVALGAPAHAQSAPASTAAPRNQRHPVSRRDGETVSILVKLSQQPVRRSRQAHGESPVLDIDGLQLGPLALRAPRRVLVTGVSAGATRPHAVRRAFGSATTVIYRNAVLIEARLAEPAQRSGASPLLAATPAGTAPLSRHSPYFKPAPKSSCRASRCCAHPADLQRRLWGSCQPGAVPPVRERTPKPRSPRPRRPFPPTPASCAAPLAPRRRLPARSLLELKTISGR